MGAKELRREIINNKEDKSRRHSVNQRIIAFMLQGEERMKKDFARRRIDIVEIPPFKQPKLKRRI